MNPPVSMHLEVATGRSIRDSFRTEMYSSKQSNSSSQSKESSSHQQQSEVSNTSICNSVVPTESLPPIIKLKRNTLSQFSNQTIKALQNKTSNFHHLNSIASAKKVPVLDLSLLKNPAPIGNPTETPNSQNPYTKSPISRASELSLTDSSFIISKPKKSVFSKKFSKNGALGFTLKQMSQVDLLRQSIKQHGFKKIIKLSKSNNIRS